MDPVLEPSITLRPADRSDLPFFYKLYASSRLAEVAAFGWDEMQQTAFLSMQFTARENAYRIQYPAADDRVILAENQCVGRLITARSDDIAVIVDISVGPQFRRKGIASKIFLMLQEQAAEAGQRLLLRVDKTNAPAYDLYQKLGFIVSDENQIMYSMTWTPRSQLK